MAHYTNALDDSKNRVIYFPFYSLDFMYRFYEEFRKQCRGGFDSLNDQSPKEVVFRRFDSNRITATSFVLIPISKYIPISSNSKEEAQPVSTQHVHDLKSPFYAVQYKAVDYLFSIKDNPKLAPAEAEHLFAVRKSSSEEATQEETQEAKQVSAQEAQYIGPQETQ
jgi:hypothetical protein